MTHESSPEKPADQSEKSSYINGMHEQAEALLAETLGVSHEELLGMNVRRIYNQAEQVRNWRRQKQHEEQEKRRQSGDPDWYLRK